MPIYAFRCAACGHARDLLMKLGEVAPTTCPACGAEAFAKQITAAGFQLKGSGWYATDFRGGNSGAPTNKDDKGEKSDGGAKTADAPAKPGTKPSTDSGAAATPAAVAAATPAKPSSGTSEPA